MPKKENSNKVINRINKTIFDRKRPLEDEDTLIKAHHRFMRYYGWIPLKDFKEMPIAMFLNLNREINEEIERENKDSRKTMAKAKRR